MTQRQRKSSKDARSLYQTRNPNPWMPIGYYRRCPISEVEFGSIENIRFITSPAI